MDDEAPTETKAIIDIIMIHHFVSDTHSEVELVYDNLSTERVIIDDEYLYNIARSIGIKKFTYKLSKFIDFSDSSESEFSDSEIEESSELQPEIEI